MKKGTKFISAMLVLVLLILLLTGTITGCEKESERREDDRTEIVLWHYWDHSYQRKVLNDLADNFNQSQESVGVVVKYIPDADFRKELTLSIVDEEAPDIALVDSADFQYFHAIQPFVDLTEEIEELDKYMSIALEPCTVEGRIMGLPCGLNCTALFYNQDRLEAAGASVPMDWEMLCQSAKAVSGDNIYGYGQSALQSEESLYAFLPMLWSLGGDVDAINSENSMQAFLILKELAQSGAMNQQSISLTGIDMAKQFAEENVAIQFLQFVSKRERMRAYIDSLNMIAPREDVMIQQYQKDPILWQFVEIFKTARQREFSKEWTPVSGVIAKAIEEIIIGERDMDKVLNESAEEIKAIREGSQ